MLFAGLHFVCPFVYALFSVYKFLIENCVLFFCFSYIYIFILGILYFFYMSIYVAILMSVGIYYIHVIPYIWEICWMIRAKIFFFYFGVSPFQFSVLFFHYVVCFFFCILSFQFCVFFSNMCFYFWKKKLFSFYYFVLILGKRTKFLADSFLLKYIISFFLFQL